MSEQERPGASRSSAKVFILQLNRLPMRRSVHGPLPGLEMFSERLGRGRAFFRDHAFESSEPVEIVSLAGVGIAGGLGFFDFLAEHGGPLGPREQTFFVQCQRQRKRMRFPGGAEDWAGRVTRNAGHGFGGAAGGFGFDQWFRHK